MKFTPKVDRVEYGGAQLGFAEIAAMFNVVMSQGGKRWTIGPESEAFEKELAEVVGVKRAVVVNSGSSALLVGIAALKLPKGSHVIIPAVNFPTAFNAIIQNGLVPHVVDVDVDSMNISLKEIEKAIAVDKQISAVLAVHVAGNPVDLTAIRAMIGDRDIKIISDNCDGLASTLDGVFIDALADISCVSFHAAHIITTGEGGAVLTNDEKVADTARKMREWGRASGTDKIYTYPGFPDDYRERYVYEEIGYNMKPLELQCALGGVQLKRLQEFKDKRRYNHKRLEFIFSQFPQFQTTVSPEDSDPCWFSFAFLTSIPRKAVFEALEGNNIECRTIFSGNILLHPAYKDVEVVRAKEYPNADRIMRDGVFISVHPSITEDMLLFEEQVLKELCSKSSTG